MVIQSEDELRARVQAGWYIKRDSKGFKVKDPQTGAEERVSGDLEDVAAKLYAQQRYGRAKETERGERGKGGIEGDYAYIIGLIRSKIDSRAPILQKWVEDILWWQHVMRDVNTKILPDLLARLSINEIDLENPEKTAEAMVKHYVELRTAAQGAEAIRQKIDSRAPILQKWAEDILWWQHILSDTTTKILPDLLARLRVEEIDLEHPERTAEALVRHYAEMRAAAQNAEALRQKYEEEIRIRDEKIRALEDRLRKLQWAFDSLDKLFVDFAARTKMTLDFLLRQIPPYLPEEARRTYRLLASRVQDIWRGVEQ